MSEMDGKVCPGLRRGPWSTSGSPNLGLIFSQGAKAVVLVGDDQVSQSAGGDALFTKPSSGGADRLD